MTQTHEFKILDFLKSEISFWLVIIGIIVSGVITFQKLDSRVSASEVQIKTDNILLQTIDTKVDAILISLTEVKKDIQYIKTK